VHMKGSLIYKMPGDLWQRFANLRALYGYMWGHPGKKLLFMGGEFGQWREWNFAESLDWHLLEPPSDLHHAQLRDFVRDLNTLYQREPALSQLDYAYDGFSWIDPNDSDNSVVSFMRRSTDPAETLVFVCNFTPVPRHGYRLGVPEPGEYYELINSDALRYGGSGLENLQPMPSGPLFWQACPHSILLTLPPLSTVILKRRPAAHAEEVVESAQQ
jgi:1,4-alpha-glucan branching enzyme